MAKRSAFGSVRKLGSGRFQARYTHRSCQYKAPRTFTSTTKAREWLVKVEASILDGTWTPPVVETTEATGPLTFGPYAADWLRGRGLEESTRDQYRRLLDNHVLPTFGEVPITAIEPATVRGWHSKLAPGHPTTRARAYSLFKTIMSTAIDDGLVDTNPCRVKGASTANRAKRIRPVEMDELEVILRKMPARYRLMVMLACWCSMRFGELAELRRADVDLRHGVVHVRRSIGHVGGQRYVKRPKSDAGDRDIHIPPHVIPAVNDHLRDHVRIGPDALLFPAAWNAEAHLAHSTLQAVFYPAREAAGRPDLRFHDLRHTGATLAAVAGATMADLMARLGHSTPRAALIYQHTAAGRDRTVASAMSELATVTSIDTARKGATG